MKEMALIHESKLRAVLYTGSPESVHKIIDMIGTKGVNNSPYGLFIDGKLFEHETIIYDDVRERIKNECKAN